MAEATFPRMQIWWPLRGLVDLVIHPRLFLAALTASSVANVILIIVAIAGSVWFWPWQDGVLAPDRLAHWAMLLAATFVILIPLIRGRAGRAIIHPILDQLGRPGERQRRRLSETMGHVLRTLPIRLLWILATIGGAAVAPMLGAVVAACGIGHLAVLDALDHALVACACPSQRRRDLRSLLLPEGIAVGVIAGVGFTLASVSVVGLLIWLPALFAGAARRAHGLVAVEGSDPAA